jgi:hypothetical protein
MHGMLTVAGAAQFVRVILAVGKRAVVSRLTFAERGRYKVTAAFFYSESTCIVAEYITGLL